MKFVRLFYLDSNLMDEMKQFVRLSFCVDSNMRGEMKRSFSVCFKYTSLPEGWKET